MYDWRASVREFTFTTKAWLPSHRQNKYNRQVTLFTINRYEHAIKLRPDEQSPEVSLKRRLCRQPSAPLEQW